MVERAKRKDVNADTMLCEVYGAAESVCGALRKILKDFNIGVDSPPFPGKASGFS